MSDMIINEAIFNTPLDGYTFPDTKHTVYVIDIPKPNKSRDVAPNDKNISRTSPIVNLEDIILAQKKKCNRNFNLIPNADTVPVDKKWQELITYNIFIMKLVEFVMSVILMTLPFALGESDTLHCLAAAPTLMLSFMFIVLYLADQAQDFAEQLYLIIQIFVNATAVMLAFLQPCTASMYYGLFYSRLLIALSFDMFFSGLAFLLSIMPYIVQPIDSWYCLASAPTLMLSLLFVVLYIVDQVQSEAEVYYLIIQVIITGFALFHLFIIGRMAGAIYGLLYIDLIVAFVMDLHYIRKQRGLKF